MTSILGHVVRQLASWTPAIQIPGYNYGSGDDVVLTPSFVKGLMRLPWHLRFRVYDYLLPHPDQLDIAYKLDLEHDFDLAINELELARTQARVEAANFSPKPGTTAAILSLPLEIRYRIYDYLLQYDEQHDRNHSSALMVWHGAREYDEQNDRNHSLALMGWYEAVEYRKSLSVDELFCR